MKLEKYEIEEFVSIVNEKLGERVERAILFGSYARGEEVPGSDVDILLVLNDKKSGDQSKVADIAGNYFLEQNVIISPKIITEEELEKKNNYGFFKEIRNEGVKVYG